MVENTDSDISRLQAEASTVYASAVELFKQKRFEDAARLCAEAEARSAYNADVASVHSAALLKLGRLQEAEQFLRFMLSYFPNDARLHLNLGSAFEMRFMQREAKAEYQVAASLDPSGAGARVRRMNAAKIAVACVSFLLMFFAFMFWPHTKWLIVALIALLIPVTVYGLYKVARLKSTERIVLYSAALAFWIALLLVTIFRS